MPAHDHLIVACMQIGDVHGLAGLMHIFMYAALILTEMVDLKVSTYCLLQSSIATAP